MTPKLGRKIGSFSQPDNLRPERLLMAQAGYFQDIAPDNRDRDRVEEKI